MKKINVILACSAAMFVALPSRHSHADGPPKNATAAEVFKWAEFLFAGRGFEFGQMREVVGDLGAIGQRHARPLKPGHAVFHEQIA